MYGTRDENGWHMDTVDGCHPGFPVSFVLDQRGIPHVCYTRSYKTALWHSFRTESGWEHEAVDYFVRGESPSMALGADGQPTICMLVESSILAYASMVDPYVLISIPDHYFYPGREFYCKVDVYAYSGSVYSHLPLFVILEVGGMFFCAPSFSAFDYYLIEIPPVSQRITVLDTFRWPENAGFGSGIIWYSAITDPEMIRVISNIDFWNMGWGE